MGRENAREGGSTREQRRARGGGGRACTGLRQDGAFDGAQALPVETKGPGIFADPLHVEWDTGEEAGAAGLGLLSAAVGRAVHVAAAAGSQGLHDGTRFVGGEIVAAEVKAAQARAREDVWEQIVDTEEARLLLN